MKLSYCHKFFSQYSIDTFSKKAQFGKILVKNIEEIV